MGGLLQYTKVPWVCITKATVQTENPMEATNSPYFHDFNAKPSLKEAVVKTIRDIHSCIKLEHPQNLKGIGCWQTSVAEVSGLCRDRV